MINDCLYGLEEINQHLAAAHSHHRRLVAAMAYLELAGMYPAVPTEEWRSQDGSSEADHLYLHFPSTPDGTYQGPDGKETLYIGNNPEQIADARRLAENSRRWEQLSDDRQTLDTWLFRREVALQDLASKCEHWPRGEILEPLYEDGDPSRIRKIPFRFQ